MGIGVCVGVKCVSGEGGFVYWCECRCGRCVEGVHVFIWRRVCLYNIMYSCYEYIYSSICMHVNRFIYSSVRMLYM